MLPPHDFLTQAEDLSLRLDGETDELRRALTSGDGARRRAACARLFRTAHTLKGSAATFGEPLVAQVAEALEDALHALTTAAGAGLGESFDERMFGAALLNAADVIGVRLRSGAGVPDDEQLADAADAVVRELRRHAEDLRAAGRRAERGRAADPDLDPVAGLLPASWRAAPPDELSLARLRDVARDGSRVFGLTLDLSLASFDDDAARCDEILDRHGEVIAARPLPTPEHDPRRERETGAAGFAAARARLGVLYASALDADELRGGLSGFDVLIETADAAADAESPRDVAPRSEPYATSERAVATDSTDGRADAVRVPLDKLDDLVLRVGELEDEVRRRLAPDDRAEMRRRFAAVQEDILRLRMTALADRLREAARAGRVAARLSGKKVEWRIAGEDVRLDRALAERLSAPLLHLVRNAVDHGIETPAERRAAGKPEQGTILIEARTDSGRVRVRVADDGRGVDPEQVRQAAVRSGIIAPGGELRPGAHLRLIFRHGFTTSERSAGDAPTSSGRGVGLDAAERALAEVGGELRVESAARRGTTFELRLPTTLAVVDAWTVRAGRHRYCVAAEYVADHDVDPRRASGGVRLAALVSAGADENLASAPAYLAVRAGASEAILGVDAIEGRGEIVVRGLGAHAAQWRGVIGASVLADGAAALLLDIPELLALRRAADKG